MVNPIESKHKKNNKTKPKKRIKKKKKTLV
jgi:hypothetical protein